ncbi:MAG TPA: hypothetical protein VGQ10_08455 [Vicinamibacterales bacterium]|nr:hypothetical protein [Vicinamibacterales bacterium]
MVVPEDDLSDLGVEAAHVLVEEVVLVVAPELVERFGGLCFRRRHHVAPGATAVERHLGLEGLVGVDRVAAVNEDVGLCASHHVVEAQPAPVGIDSPALSNRVGGPREGDVTPAGRRRRRKAACHRLTPRAQIGEVLEDHAVEDALTVSEVGEDDACGVIRRFECRGTGGATDVAEALRRRVLDEHPGRAVAATPDDGAAGADVAGGHALRDTWSRALGPDDGRRPAGPAALRYEQSGRAGCKRPSDERAPAHLSLRRHRRAMI